MHSRQLNNTKVPHVTTRYLLAGILFQSMTTFGHQLHAATSLQHAPGGETMQNEPLSFQSFLNGDIYRHLLAFVTQQTEGFV
jgi:hypothetical protein